MDTRDLTLRNLTYALFVELGQRLGALVTVRGAGLPAERRPAQQAGQGGRIVTAAGRHQRHRRLGVAYQTGVITEDGGDHRMVEVRVEER